MELIRDTYGIPHVFAETTAGAFYGVGYAAAEDRLLQMEYVRRRMRGQLAEIYGKKALQSDMRVRLIGFAEHADALLLKLADPELMLILDAYCRGVNDQVAARGGKLPSAFGELGLTQFAPWTPADCLLSWLRVQDRFDTAWESDSGPLPTEQFNVIDPGGAVIATDSSTTRPASRPANEEHNAKDHPPTSRPVSSTVDPPGPKLPPAEKPTSTSPIGTDTTKPADDMRAEDPLSMFESTESDGGLPKASNNWTVAGWRMTTGKAVLLSDPRTTVQSPPIWYEFHLSGGPYQCRGMGVPGCPGIFVGWNSQVAWGATALRASASNLYQLTSVEGKPDHYLLDGNPTPYTQVRDEHIHVKGEPDTVVEHRETVWGPVVTQYIRELTYSNDPTEYALQHSMLVDVDRHTLQALVRLMKSSNWTEARESIRHWRGPSIHFLYADANGHIGYTALGVIPIRPTDGRASSARGALDGSRTSAKWLGFIPFEDLPTLYDPPCGYISTANNLAIDPAAAPRGLTIGATGDTQRSWRVRQILSKYLSTPEAKMTPQQVMDMHVDAVEPCSEAFTQLALTMRELGVFPVGTPADLTVRGLSHWNDKLQAGQHWFTFTDNPVYSLIVLIEPAIQNSFRRANGRGEPFTGGTTGACKFFKAVKADIRSFATRKDIQEWMTQTLADIWKINELRAASAPSSRLSGFEIPLEEYHLLPTPEEGYIPASGPMRRGPVMSTKTMSTEKPLRCISRETLWCQPEQTYTQFVDFANLQESLALLPPGSSGDPTSIYYKAQMDLWIEGKLRKAPLMIEHVVQRERTKLTPK